VSGICHQASDEDEDTAHAADTARSKMTAHYAHEKRPRLASDTREHANDNEKKEKLRARDSRAEDRADNIRHKQSKGHGSAGMREVQKKGMSGDEHSSADEDMHGPEDTRDTARPVKRCACARPWCKLGRTLNKNLREQMKQLHQRIAEDEGTRFQQNERRARLAREMRELQDEMIKWQSKA
jgi:hypothetical protein